MSADRGGCATTAAHFTHLRAGERRCEDGRVHPGPACEFDVSAIADPEPVWCGQPATHWLVKGRRYDVPICREHAERLMTYRDVAPM